MESGKVLPFLCLILVCVLHLSSGQCPQNEELVECRNDCNTCELQGVCYDCSTISCDCIRGFARDDNGVCIPKSICHVSNLEVLAAESEGCPNDFSCHKSCQRRKFRTGKCVGPNKQNCVCRP